jgi:hypothetical protein
MNERLKQLAREAGLLHYNPNREPNKLEKFAKLIVKEVMQLTHDEESRFYNMNEDLLALVMENFRELIKEHFGVEEEHFGVEE